MIIGKKSGKLNNKGMTLVELLVSIAILSIVIVPVLSCFVTALRLSGTSKERQRLNAASQSIMEGFKAYTVKDLVDQFDDSINGANFKLYGAQSNPNDSYEAYSVDSRTETWTYVDPDPLSPSPTVNYSVDVGTFKLKNLKYEGKNYDAKIEVNLLKEDSDGDGAIEYDGTELIRYIEDINGYQDCVYLQKYDEFVLRYNELLNRVVSKLNEIDAVYGYTPGEGEEADPELGYHVSDLRMNTISIDRKSVVNIYGDKVIIKVDYVVNVSGHPYYGSDGLIHYYSTPSGGIVIPTEETYYDSTATGATLSNVFLFVYPAYSSTYSGYPVANDTYTVNNASGSNKNVFFIKQINPNLTTSNLETCENAYTPSITYSNVNLYHNLAENLAGGATVGAASFHGLGSSKIIDGISIKKAQALVYEIVVKLYEEGSYDAGFTSEPLYTLNGTKNNY